MTKTKNTGSALWAILAAFVAVGMVAQGASAGNENVPPLMGQGPLRVALGIKAIKPATGAIMQGADGKSYRFAGDGWEEVGATLAPTPQPQPSFALPPGAQAYIAQSLPQGGSAAPQPQAQGFTPSFGAQQGEASNSVTRDYELSEAAHVAHLQAIAAQGGPQGAEAAWRLSLPRGAKAALGIIGTNPDGSAVPDGVPKAGLKLSMPRNIKDGRPIKTPKGARPVMAAGVTGGVGMGRRGLHAEWDAEAGLSLGVARAIIAEVASGRVPDKANGASIARAKKALEALG